VNRACKRCREPMSDVDAARQRTARGRKYPRPWCRACEAKASAGYVSPAVARYKTERATGVRRAHWICRDSRHSDRLNNRVYDLDVKFVETLISEGCAYCWGTELRMTLDRIDNSVGHTRTNVVPACERCNFMRRDMPYAAWCALLPAIRSAQEKGLFGQWTGAVHTRK
jgi:hypothetical protein